MAPASSTPPRGSWSAGRSSNTKMKEIARPAARLSGTGNPTQRQALRALDEGAATPAHADTVCAAADWLRLDLFSNLRKACDAVRPPAPPLDVPTVASTWGLARFEWPRCEIVNRTARIISGVVLDHWVSPDSSRAREAVPVWTAALWQKLSLDLEGFIERLRQTADSTLGMPCEQLLTQMGEAAQSKGWLARTPDAAQVGHTLTQWDQLVGHPKTSANREPTGLEEALRVTATDLATAAQSEIADAVPHLIDNAKYRLAGAEEAARQLLSDLIRMATAMGNRADTLDAQANAAYDLMSAHAHGTRGRGTAAALSEALKNYPRTRYQAVLARRAARTYAALRENLTLIKNDMASCRQRLVTFKKVLRSEIDAPAPMPSPRDVMPPGCSTIEEAAKRYLEVLTDDDLHKIESWIQQSMERSYGGLYQACLNTAEGPTGLLSILRSQCRAYLDTRLGDVDLAGMFAQKYGPLPLLVDAFRTARQEAEPNLLDAGPWSRGAITVFAAPPGEAGDPLRHAAFQAFPDAGTTVFTDTPDEAVVFCEYPQVPLAALPHFGPAWQAAYASAFETLQCTPHTRTDVSEWVGIDAAGP